MALEENDSQAEARVQYNGCERESFIRLKKAGFHIRPPPPPHQLDSFTTSEDDLFQTIHMGPPVIDMDKYILVIDGSVSRPLALTFDQLKSLPPTSITAFHECYGSPLRPAINALWRVGNVKWTGVQFSHLLSLAGFSPHNEEHFVWSEGLDCGAFSGVEADRYQKDLPMERALQPEVLVAYEMNGEPLNVERGGPVRLVVPGFFGTNSTKWLCRLSVQRTRAPGPYTTTFYNEIDPEDPQHMRLRPVWNVEVNSMITKPAPNEVFTGSEVVVRGWTWGDDAISAVRVSGDGGNEWTSAHVAPRKEYEWQRFTAILKLPAGTYTLIARAVSSTGKTQPLIGRRNHVHRVPITVLE